CAPLRGNGEADVDAIREITHDGGAFGGEAIDALPASIDDAFVASVASTALTIDLLDVDGLHRGGRIAPSPTLMREALHRRAPQLPLTGGDYAEFADDTLPGLASGCEGAALALIARSRALADDLLGVPPRVLLHGGGSAALLPHMDGVVAAPALVLEGLARWARVMAP